MSFKRMGDVRPKSANGTVKDGSGGGPLEIEFDYGLN